MEMKASKSSGHGEGFFSNPKGSAFPISVPLILLILFFLSGVCGLVYQVVWSRMLTLVMGNTVFATSTVLAAFMGGLAIGSWLLGRFADRYGHPLIFYGVLECVLGLYCFLFPVLLDAMVPSYQYLYRVTGGEPMVLTLSQFIFSSFLILLPATMMGGTLPVLSKFFVKTEDEIGSTTGKLYAINTLGAVLGAASAGFFLVPQIGIKGSLYAAAVANLAIGLCTFLVIRMQPDEPALRAPTRFLARPGDPPTQKAWLVMVAFSISGGTALIYEVTWTRSLSLLLGPSVYAFSLMLSAFITGLALGSWLMSRIVDRMKSPMTVLGILQWGIAFSSLALVPLINFLPRIIRETLRTSDGSFSEILLLNASVSFFVMLIPATFFGATFPVAVKLYSRSLEAIGKRLGTLYAGNTVGAVVGALAAGFLLIPSIGLQNTIFAACLINGALGAGLLLTSQFSQRWIRTSVVATSGSVLLVIMLMIPAWSKLDLMSGPYRYFYDSEETAQTVLNREELLYYREGMTGTVAVKQRGAYRFITISGKVDAGNRPADMMTQILSAHIPLLLAEKTEDVLVIGLASGVTLGAASQYPVDRIDGIEISYEVLEAATFFEDINHHVLQDPRVQIRIQDGRNHLLLTDRQYDVIISEPSNPWMPSVANLYTQEFFELARNRLKPGGVMAQWIQAYNFPNPMLKSVIRTFGSVFPHMSLWLAGPGDLLLVGSIEPLPIDVERFKSRLADRLVRDDLRRIGTYEWWHLIPRAVVVGPILNEAVKDAPIHTDDLPFLEFMLPKTFLKNTTDENSDWIEALIRNGSRPSPMNGSILISGRDWQVLSRTIQAVDGR